jgi:hypothetical protein
VVVNAYGGSGKAQGRDGACTPKWLAELIGPVKLDPATNDRSHVEAQYKCSLEYGGNGLAGTAGRWGYEGDAPFYAGPSWTVFCNPPYARGQVIRWVRHYKHTRFIFLLRWDPSTKWFAELIQETDWVWFPAGQRIEFEPPPGVKFSKNPFPHALYLRDPSPDLLERLKGCGYLLDARLVRGQSVEHGHRQDSGSGRAGEAEAGGAGGGGGSVDECIARLREFCQERSTPGRTWGFDEAEWRRALERPIIARDAAGGEVPGPAPRRQRVRRGRRGGAAGDNGGGEVGAERAEGEAAGDVPQR